MDPSITKEEKKRVLRLYKDLIHTKTMDTIMSTATTAFGLLIPIDKGFAYSLSALSSSAMSIASAPLWTYQLEGYIKLNFKLGEWNNPIIHDEDDRQIYQEVTELKSINSKRKADHFSPLSAKYFHQRGRQRIYKKSTLGVDLHKQRYKSILVPNLSVPLHAFITEWRRYEDGTETLIHHNAGLSASQSGLHYSPNLLHTARPTSVEYLLKHKGSNGEVYRDRSTMFGAAPNMLFPLIDAFYTNRGDVEDRAKVVSATFSETQYSMNCEAKSTISAIETILGGETYSKFVNFLASSTNELKKLESREIISLIDKITSTLAKVFNHPLLIQEYKSDKVIEGIRASNDFYTRKKLGLGRKLTSKANLSREDLEKIYKDVLKEENKLIDKIQSSLLDTSPGVGNDNISQGFTRHRLIPKITKTSIYEQNKLTLLTIRLLSIIDSGGGKELMKDADLVNLIKTLRETFVPLNHAQQNIELEISKENTNDSEAKLIETVGESGVIGLERRNVGDKTTTIPKTIQEAINFYKASSQSKKDKFNNKTSLVCNIDGQMVNVSSFDFTSDRDFTNDLLNEAKNDSFNDSPQDTKDYASYILNTENLKQISEDVNHFLSFIKKARNSTNTMNSVLDEIDDLQSKAKSMNVSNSNQAECFFTVTRLLLFVKKAMLLIERSYQTQSSFLNLEEKKGLNESYKILAVHAKMEQPAMPKKGNHDSHSLSLSATENYSIMQKYHRSFFYKAKRVFMTEMLSVLNNNISYLSQIESVYLGIWKKSVDKYNSIKIPTKTLIPRTSSNESFIELDHKDDIMKKTLLAYKIKEFRRFLDSLEICKGIIAGSVLVDKRERFYRNDGVQGFDRNAGFLLGGSVNDVDKEEKQFQYNERAGEYEIYRSHDITSKAIRRVVSKFANHCIVSSSAAIDAIQQVESVFCQFLKSDIGMEFFYDNSESQNKNRDYGSAKLQEEIKQNISKEFISTEEDISKLNALSKTMYSDNGFRYDFNIWRSNRSGVPVELATVEQNQERKETDFEFAEKAVTVMDKILKVKLRNLFKLADEEIERIRKQEDVTSIIHSDLRLFLSAKEHLDKAIINKNKPDQTKQLMHVATIARKLYTNISVLQHYSDNAKLAEYSTLISQLNSQSVISLEDFVHSHSSLSTLLNIFRPLAKFDCVNENNQLNILFEYDISVASLVDLEDLNIAESFHNPSLSTSIASKEIACNIKKLKYGSYSQKCEKELSNIDIEKVRIGEICLTNLLTKYNAVQNYLETISHRRDERFDAILKLLTELYNDISKQERFICEAIKGSERHLSLFSLKDIKMHRLDNNQSVAIGYNLVDEYIKNKEYKGYKFVRENSSTEQLLKISEQKHGTYCEHLIIDTVALLEMVFNPKSNAKIKTIQNLINRIKSSTYRPNINNTQHYYIGDKIRLLLGNIDNKIFLPGDQSTYTQMLELCVLINDMLLAFNIDEKSKIIIKQRLNCIMEDLVQKQFIKKLPLTNLGKDKYYQIGGAISRNIRSTIMSIGGRKTPTPSHSSNGQDLTTKVKEIRAARIMYFNNRVIPLVHEDVTNRDIEDPSSTKRDTLSSQTPTPSHSSSGDESIDEMRPEKRSKKRADSKKEVRLKRVNKDINQKEDTKPFSVDRNKGNIKDKKDNTKSGNDEVESAKKIAKQMTDFINSSPELSALAVELGRQIVSDEAEAENAIRDPNIAFSLLQRASTDERINRALMENRAFISMGRKFCNSNESRPQNQGSGMINDLVSQTITTKIPERATRQQNSGVSSRKTMVINKKAEAIYWILKVLLVVDKR